MVSLSTNRSGSGGPWRALLRSRRQWLPPILGIGGFLIAWQISSSLGLTRLPGPLSLWTNERTRELLLYPFYDRGGLDKGLFWQTVASLGRVAQGYLLAAIVGIGAGISVGLSPMLNRAFDPLFQFLRMVAPLAWVPIALVLFQKNQPAAIFVIFITAVWPILINTAEGVRQIPQDYRNVALVLQMSKGRFFTKILLPSTLPYIFTGLRISIGLAWLAIIAAEIVMSGIVGIGFFIWDAYQQNYVSDIVLAVRWHRPAAGSRHGLAAEPHRGRILIHRPARTSPDPTSRATPMNSTTTSPLVLLASRYLVFGLIALPFALFLLAQP